MTKMEFSGPGLSSDQWERINDLAVSLQPAQALWLSGYFAGVGSAARGAGGFDQVAVLDRAKPEQPAPRPLNWRVQSGAWADAPRAHHDQHKRRAHLRRQQKQKRQKQKGA